MRLPRLALLVAIAPVVPAQTLLHQLSDAQATVGDRLGNDVDVGGGKVFAGAPYADTADIESGAVVVYDLDNGLQEARYYDPAGELRDRFGWSISHDDGLLAVGAPGHLSPGKVYLLEAATGVILQVLDTPSVGFQRFGETVELDEGVLAATSFNFETQVTEVSCYDVATGTLLSRVQGPNHRYGENLEIGDGRLFITSEAENSMTGDVEVIDLSTGSLIHEVKPTTPYRFFGNAIAMTEDHVVVSGTELADNNFYPSVWFYHRLSLELESQWVSDSTTATFPHLPLGSMGDLVAMGRIVTRVFDPSSGEVLATMSGNGGPEFSKLASDGGRIVRGAALYDNFNGGVFVFAPGDYVGWSYCTTSHNSTGDFGRLAAYGFRDVATETLVLHASSLPPGELAMFVNAPMDAFIQQPGGATGNLCLGGTIGRHLDDVARVGINGSIAVELDFHSLPRRVGTHSIQPGETWYFQTWFTDGPGSNFTFPLRVTFQ